MRFHFGLLLCLFLLCHSAGFTQTVQQLPLTYSCGVQWPGWQILMDNEYCQSTKYPLVQMFDGNPATAWVYYKAWRDLPPGVLWGECNNPDERFNHGIGATIDIRNDEGKTFSADGIGIINGYAKTPDIYWGNNRITSIHVHCEGHEQNWDKSFALEERIQLQRLNFPHQKLLSLCLKVENVAVGPDDDLCISDIVLYNHGKPVPWKVPASVLYIESGDNWGDSLQCASLWKRNGQRMYHHGKPVYVNGNARLPGTGFTLLGDDHTLYVFDFTRNKFIAEQTFSGSIEESGMD